VVQPTLSVVEEEEEVVKLEVFGLWDA